MPTFSQNPHIDYWPVGASLQPNNEFVNGSTAGYTTFSPSNPQAVLTSNVDRAPGALTVGCAEVFSTQTAGGDAHQLYPNTTFPTFASTDRVFIEAWVKLVGTTGTVGSVQFRAGARLLNSAGTWLAGVPLSTKTIAVADGWTRLWGTTTGAALIGVNASAARVLTDVICAPQGASAGATTTWRVGKVNTYITPAMTTRLDMVAGGALISQGMPYTAADSTTTLEMREAVDLGAGGGPINVA